MQSSACVIVPGRLDARTGGYEYDRRVVNGLRQRGWLIDVHELQGTFPHPSDDDLAQADRVLRSIPDRALVLVDGLAFGAMPFLAEQHASRLRFVPIVHMSLAEEIGLDAHTADSLRSSERRALAAARIAIVTGSRTAQTLVREGVGQDRIVVVEPGTDRAPLARGSGGPVVHLVCVATLNAGKGHQALFEALARLHLENWRLTCAGSQERDPKTVASLRKTLNVCGLVERVSLVGALDAPQLADLYDRADVFVLATLSESYGMAVAEALARGLPIVSTMTGAIPALVGNQAGLLAPPGDVGALAVALSRVITDAALRARLAEGARAVRQRLPAWEDAVEKVADALQSTADS